ncbi:MAG: thioesterase family protein [Oleibacter sp.]|nr:thioesterase family protein [Thalassolituus sp.]
MAVDIRVRGYHLDIYQHVNNARYLEFLEESRWDFFDKTQLISTFESSNLAFVMVNLNINYRRPAFVNELVRVTAYFSKVGNKSLQLSQEIILLKENDCGELINDAVIVDAVGTFCLMDQCTEKTILIDGELRETLTDLIEDAPCQ